MKLSQLLVIILYNYLLAFLVKLILQNGNIIDIPNIFLKLNLLILKHCLDFIAVIVIVLRNPFVFENVHKFEAA